MRNSSGLDIRNDSIALKRPQQPNPQRKKKRLVVAPGGGRGEITCKGFPLRVVDTFWTWDSGNG